MPNCKSSIMTRAALTLLLSALLLATAVPLAVNASTTRGLGLPSKEAQSLLSAAVSKGFTEITAELEAIAGTALKSSLGVDGRKVFSYLAEVSPPSGVSAAAASEEAAAALKFKALMPARELASVTDNGLLDLAGVAALVERGDALPATELNALVYGISLKKTKGLPVTEGEQLLLKEVAESLKPSGQGLVRFGDAYLGKARLDEMKAVVGSLPTSEISKQMQPSAIAVASRVASRTGKAAVAAAQHFDSCVARMSARQASIFNNADNLNNELHALNADGVMERIFRKRTSRNTGLLTPLEIRSMYMEVGYPVALIKRAGAKLKSADVLVAMAAVARNKYDLAADEALEVVYATLLKVRAEIPLDASELIYLREMTKVMKDVQTGLRVSVNGVIYSPETSKQLKELLAKLKAPGMQSSQNALATLSLSEQSLLEKLFSKHTSIRGERTVQSPFERELFAVNNRLVSVSDSITKKAFAHVATIYPRVRVSQLNDAIVAFEKKFRVPLGAPETNAALTAARKLPDGNVEVARLEAYLNSLDANCKRMEALLAEADAQRAIIEPLQRRFIGGRMVGPKWDRDFLEFTATIDAANAKLGAAEREVANLIASHDAAQRTTIDRLLTSIAQRLPKTTDDQARHAWKNLPIFQHGFEHPPFGPDPVLVN